MRRMLLLRQGMFDDKLINVLKKYGVAAPIAGGAIAASTQGNKLMPPPQQSAPANQLLGQLNT